VKHRDVSINRALEELFEMQDFTATFYGPEEQLDIPEWSMKVHKHDINTHRKNDMLKCQSQPFIIPELI